MTKYVYQGEELYHVISNIRDIVLDSPYNQYMKEATLDRHQISRQFRSVLNMLKDNKDFYYDEDDSLNALLLRWRHFFEEAPSMAKEHRIKLYNQLWNNTDNLLHEVSSGNRFYWI